MACYLACKCKRFAAVGGVAGGMSVKMFNDSDAANPVPVIQIHGTKDPINSYKGNLPSTGIEAVIEFWRLRNGCAATTTTTAMPDLYPADKCTAEKISYSGGTKRNQVELIRITGGGLHGLALINRANQEKCVRILMPTGHLAVFPAV